MAGRDNSKGMSRYKEFLEQAVTRMLAAIKSDQLIKVMALEETSESFILQRVNQIIDIIYKQDREKLIQQLISQNESLKSRSSTSGDSAELSRLRAEIADLQARLKNSRDDGSLSRLQSENLALKSKVSSQKDEISDLLNKIEQLERELSMKGNSNGKLSQLNSTIDRLQKELAASQRRVKTLQEELEQMRLREQKARREADEAKAELANLRSKSGTTKEIDLVRLMDELEETRSKLRDLKDLIKRRDLEKEDLIEALRKVEIKLKEQAHQTDQTLKSQEARHHETLMRLRKQHKMALEELDAYHLKEHRSLGECNEEALQQLTRIHRDQLERTRRQSEVREKGFVEMTQKLEKRNRELEAALVDGKKRHEAARHPRFSIDEIARLQEQLALKDSAILSVQNERNMTSAELERTVSERNLLIGQLQNMHEQVENVRVKHDRLLIETTEMENMRTAKFQQVQNMLEGQIYSLASENQRLLNELKMFEGRYQDTLKENFTIGLREKTLASESFEAKDELQRLAEQNLVFAQANQANMRQMKELVEQAQLVPLLQERIKILESNENKLMQLERERGELAQRNEILRVDFQELTRQLRESHVTNKQLNAELVRAKSDLARAGNVIDYSRDRAERGFEDAEQKRTLYAAQMQRTINELVANFHAEQQALLEQFTAYQSRIKKEMSEQNNYLCEKYEYMLEARDIERQRQKEALSEQLQAEARAQMRDLQLKYETRQFQILSELERLKHSSEVQKNDMINSFAFEINASQMRQGVPPPPELVPAPSRSQIERTLSKLKRDIELNRRG